MRLAFLLLLAAWTSASSAPLTGVCSSDLPAAVNNLIGSVTGLNLGSWAILLETQSTPTTPGTVLFSMNADNLYTPASNTKLLTVASYLVNAKESPTPIDQQVLVTPVHANVTSPSHLEALCIEGVGDPSLNTTQLQMLAQSLASKGVATIDTLVLNDAAFSPSEEFPISWEWEDSFEQYGAQIGTFILDVNTVYFNVLAAANGTITTACVFPVDCTLMGFNMEQLVIGTTSNIGYAYGLGENVLYLSGTIVANSTVTGFEVAARFPTKRMAAHVMAAFQGATPPITVGRAVIGSQNQCTTLNYASIVSQPISDLVDYTLQVSQNTYAEAFLRMQASASDVASGMSSATSGLNAVRQRLIAMGVPPASFNQVDGCGVSRHNLIAVRAIAGVLQGMATIGGQFFNDFVSYLPLGGVSGTLSNRFINTPGQGRVYGKTGSMTGVNALSGYINRTGLAIQGLTAEQSGSLLVYSVVVTGTAVGSSKVRGMMDQIINLMLTVNPSTSCVAPAQTCPSSCGQGTCDAASGTCVCTGNFVGPTCSVATSYIAPGMVALAAVLSSAFATGVAIAATCFYFKRKQKSLYSNVVERE